MHYFSSTKRLFDSKIVGKYQSIFQLFISLFREMSSCPRAKLQGNYEALRNIYCPRANNSPYFQAKVGYCVYYSLNIFFCGSRLYYFVDKTKSKQKMFILFLHFFNIFTSKIISSWVKDPKHPAICDCFQAIALNINVFFSVKFAARWLSDDNHLPAERGYWVTWCFSTNDAREKILSE